MAIQSTDLEMNDEDNISVIVNNVTHVNEQNAPTTTKAPTTMNPGAGADETTNANHIVANSHITMQNQNNSDENATIL